MLLFTKQSGQWRMGFNGPTGLDYALSLALMDRMKLDEESHAAMIDAIHVMEMAALEEMKKA